MTLYYSPEEKLEYSKKIREVHIQSRLGFLNAHNGLRKGSLHLVIGTAGGGKSTLTRAVLSDVVLSNNKAQVGVWLSEESIEDYKMQLSQSFRDESALLRTEAFSEVEDSLDLGEMTFFEWVEFNRSDVLLIDNLTTSKLYMDKKPQEQAAFVSKLKALTKKLNIATVIIAHTDANVSDSQASLINLNQIRGSKSIVNMVEFAYILQRCDTPKGFYPTLRVVKHRSQELIHGIYFLEFDSRLRCYSGDRSISFEEFIAAWETRNRLR